ncbi:MAG: transcriptional repressor [Arenicellales bacterium]
MQDRNTRQKQVIANLVQAAERPLSVQEILTLGRKRLPGLGVATVYRSIKRLKDAGEIRAVTIPGDTSRYETAGHHHHHFKCSRCDKVYEIEGCVNELKRLVPKGFTIEDHDLTFYGRCRNCA